MIFDKVNINEKQVMVALEEHGHMKETMKESICLSIGFSQFAA
jgi:hypothetical protein